MRHAISFFLASTLISNSSIALAQTTGPSVAVEQPYAIATSPAAKTADVYMTLENRSQTPDRLIGASTDAADKLQIHEMSVVNGVMKMRQLESGLSIPGGGSVVLKAGGYHVMLFGLRKPLSAGDSFPLTLTFEKAGNVSTTLSIRAREAQ